MPEGETPQTIHLCAYEDFVDEVRPGDRVSITGIYKAMGVRVNSTMRTLKNIYRTYVDVISYKKQDNARVNVQDNDAARNEEMFNENNLDQMDKKEGDEDIGHNY